MSTKNTIKTEHAGAKNRGGFWGLRNIAKQKSKKLRRLHSKLVCKQVEN